MVRESACTTSTEMSDSANNHVPDKMEIRDVRSSTKAKKVADLLDSEFTVSKLQFSRVELVGREEQVALLKERLEACIAKKTTELVLIKGVSGCGKSALAETLEKEVSSYCHKRTGSGTGATKQQQAICVQGKFDQKAAEEPYSTAIHACHELGSACLLDPDLSQSMKERLQNDLIGMEKVLLMQVLPILSKILEEEPKIMKQSKSTHALEEDAEAVSKRQDIVVGRKELLESAFRKYIQASASCFAPLVIILDDLQWSDSGTLDLLHSVVADGTAPNLMLVGCYRADEVGEGHLLDRMLKALKEQNKQFMEIELAGLTVDQSNQILMVLLSTDNADKIRPLAELCHQRSLGNVFFFLTYCKMLHLENLLRFDLGTFAWKWDLEEIQAKTGATANVVDLMGEQMNKASPDLLHLLKLAGCLGSSFSAQSLSLIWLAEQDTAAGGDNNKNNSSKQPSQLEFMKLLEDAIQHGFLERSDNGLRWIHDKIQEAAMRLETKEAFAARQHQVGQILYSYYSPKELDEELFAVVNLLNCGDSASTELAQLNLRAATKANNIGAFSIQASFAANGINNLPQNCWKLHKHTSLELYTLYAQAESCQGNFEKMKELCDVVLQQDECSIVDRAICSHVVIQSIARKGDLKEAIDRSIDLVRKLGCKIPANPTMQTIKGVSQLLRFQWRMRNPPTEAELSSMPLLMDPVHKQIMMVLSTLIVYAYLVDDEMVQVLGGLAMNEMTLKHGIADQSQRSFTGSAVILMHVLKEWQMAVRVAKIGLAMHKRLEDQGEHPTEQSAAIGIAHGLIIGWVEPLKCQLSPLIEGYKRGMEVGDTEWAFANIVWYLEISLLSGSSLSSVEADIRTYLTQFEALQAMAEYSTMVRSHWQACLNLMGKSEHTSTLSGIALNEYDFDPTRPPERVAVFKGFLCVYFGEHELGAKIALDRTDQVLKARPGNPCVMVDPYLRAMSLYAMARRTGKTRFKRQAASARKTVKAWAKLGNPNVYHHLELLNAERAAVFGKKNTSELYNRATRSAVRAGCIHDAALANERHAEYLLESGQADKEFVSHQLKEAIQRYEEWGATKKAELMREMYAVYL